MAKDSKKKNDGYIDVEALVASLQKEGIEASAKADDRTHVDSYLCSGVLSVNYALSEKYLTGGWPKGKVTVINGSEASGKTWWAILACISCQRDSEQAVYLDAERTLSRQLYTKMGGNWDQLIKDYPDSLEQTWKNVFKTISVFGVMYPGQPLTIVIDSLADLPTEKEIELRKKNKFSEGDIRSATMWRANVNAKYLAQVDKEIKSGNVTLIILNQLVDNIGVTYGDKKVMPGGNKLRFASSIIMRSSVSSKIYSPHASKDDIKKGLYDPIGILGRISNHKNKVATPFKWSKYSIIWNTGVNPLSGFVESLVRYDKLKRTSASSLKWILKASDGTEFPMMLGSAADAEKNIKQYVIEKPQLFFDKDDWDEKKAKRLVDILKSNNFDFAVDDSSEGKDVKEPDPNDDGLEAVDAAEVDSDN